VTARRFRKAVGKVDVVFENVGRETLNESLMTLRPQGTLILVGNVSGEPLELLRPALSIMREHRMVGSAAYTRKEFEEAARWIGEQRVRPVYEAFPLTSINDVYRALEQRSIRGRAVLLP
jgi:alcohol dehydrogenase